MSPTVSILLPYSPDHADRADLLDVITSLDSRASSLSQFSVESTTFLGCGTVSAEGARPFSLAFQDFEAEDEASRSALKAEFFFLPFAEITAAAHANRPVDHRILADLARFCAKRYGGIINFGCDLGVQRATVGKLVRIPFSVQPPLASFFHVGDLTFLKHWLEQPQFHMCK
jgi:hypothetical protein